MAGGTLALHAVGDQVHKQYLHVVGDVGRDERAAAPFALSHVDLDKVESIAKRFSYFEQR